MREMVASLNAGSRQRYFPRRPGRKTTAAASTNRIPSTTGNTQMACRVENAKIVSAGSCMPMPPNTPVMLGPMTVRPQKRQHHRNQKRHEHHDQRIGHHAFQPRPDVALALEIIRQHRQRAGQIAAFDADQNHALVKFRQLARLRARRPSACLWRGRLRAIAIRRASCPGAFPRRAAAARLQAECRRAASRRAAG